MAEKTKIVLYSCHITSKLFFELYIAATKVPSCTHGPDYNCACEVIGVITAHFIY